MADEKFDASALYTDETQGEIEKLKEEAKAAAKFEEEHPFGALDIVKDIIFFFVVTAVAFGWMLLMLLIVSFVTLSYLHFEFSVMVTVSVITAIIVAIAYLIIKVNKYVVLSRKKTGA